MSPELASKEEDKQFSFSSPGSGYIGSDPEFFVVSKRYNKILSAHILERKQTLPIRYQPTELGRAVGTIKRDGPALEVNPEPTTCRDDQVPHFFWSLKAINDMLTKQKLTGYTVSGRCVGSLSKKSLTNPPEDVSEFGCNPDWDAYSLTEKSPVCPVGSTRRYAGGHIHIGLGYNQNAKNKLMEDIVASSDVAIALDYLIGFPAVGVLGPKFADDERERRQFYGQAGSHRVKQTFEYRVLSNTGFALSPILMSMWLGVAKFLPHVNHNEIKRFLKQANKIIPVSDIRNAINNHDYEFVWESYEAWLRLYPQNLHKYIPHNLAQMYNAAQNGTSWSDDILFNWGVGYSSFVAEHHAYWGHENGARGFLSKTIFPGEVSKSVQKMLDSYGFTNTGYNIDNKGFRKHPSENAVVKRSWEG